MTDFDIVDADVLRSTQRSRDLRNRDQSGACGPKNVYCPNHRCVAGFVDPPVTLVPIVSELQRNASRTPYLTRGSVQSPWGRPVITAQGSPTSRSRRASPRRWSVSCARPEVAR